MADQYHYIINSASTTNKSTTDLVAQMIEKYIRYSLTTTDYFAVTFQPVFAQPQKWYDASTISLREVSLDPATMTLHGLAEDYTQIPSDTDKTESWSLHSGSEQQTIHSDSNITSISCEALVVNLSRPWLDTDLFRTKGWSMPGQDAGYISNGKLTQNPGILPLYTTGLLVAHTSNIEAEFHESDLQFAIKALTANKPLFLGPIPISAEEIKSFVSNSKQLIQNSTTLTSELKLIKQTDPPLFLLGYISDLLPFSPPLTTTS